mmetsp:Transcript_17363/g.50693  ORF Transcript_17363/g.50693 Transcript_17363/m.50693 type:complete len:227 (-) Transcript_17363:1508-2188(-)
MRPRFLRHKRTVETAKATPRTHRERRTHPFAELTPSTAYGISMPFSSRRDLTSCNSSMTSFDLFISSARRSCCCRMYFCSCSDRSRSLFSCSCRLSSSVLVISFRSRSSSSSFSAFPKRAAVLEVFRMLSATETGDGEVGVGGARPALLSFFCSSCSSARSWAIKTSVGSTSTTGRVLSFLHVAAYRRVERVSSWDESDGEMFATMVVLVLPERESLRRRVSLESR